MALWQWKELTAACGLTGSDEGPDVTGVSIDTRTLVPGDLFVALSGDPGPRFHASIENARDGHDFIADAEAKGAAAVMTSRPVETSLPAIRVEDTLDGLWDLGRYSRERMHGKVAAVTGSSGKTTARQWLQEALAGRLKVHASEGSFNNHWGVPLSLARMPADSEIGVLEVGMNHPGELAPLARLVTPHVALIVNVVPAHLGFFDSLDGIRREKLTVVEGLVPGGTLVAPDDLECGGVRADRLVTFGFSNAATISGKAREEGDRSHIKAKVDGEVYEFTLAGAGEHRVLTCLGVMGTAWALGADLHDVCMAFEHISTPPGRGNIVKIGDITIIDDSYNANPVSMRYALEALARRKAGRRIAVLGEMRELGADSERMHLDLAPFCESLDGIISVGEGLGGLARDRRLHHLGHFDSADQLDPAGIASLLRHGDTVLVKGANKVFWVNDFVAKLAGAIGELW